MAGLWQIDVVLYGLRVVDTGILYYLELSDSLLTKSQVVTSKLSQDRNLTQLRTSDIVHVCVYISNALTTWHSEDLSMLHCLSDVQTPLINLRLQQESINDNRWPV
jgi:hypothetical protein